MRSLLHESPARSSFFPPWNPWPTHFPRVSLACGLILVLCLSVPMRAAEAQAPPQASPKRAAPLLVPLPHTPEGSIRSGKGRDRYGVQLGNAWQGQAPGLSANGQCENVPGGNPVCGSIHTVAPHPTNADILFAGAVNGGIWRTQNATAASPTWTPLTDQQASLSIGDIEFDPTDAGLQTLVAGIGAYSNFFGLGGPSIGILRTTDGGATWTELGRTDLAASGYVAAVIARGNTILVGAVNGLYRSTNGGVSFALISGLAGLPNGTVYDLAGDPGNASRIYAAVSGAAGGVFRSNDSGANWTNVTSAAIDGLVSGATDNLRLSVSAATGNAVFLGIANSGQLAGVFRSADQGGTWTAMDLPRTREGSSNIGIHPGGQSGNNFALTSDPTDGNVVYVSGDRQPIGAGPNGIPGDNDDAWPNSLGARDYTGRMFRGTVAVAPTGAVPSPQWTALTHSGTASNSSPHADAGDMDFDANGNIIESNDGGIYRRTSPRTATGNWFSVIGSIQVAQFHDIAYDGRWNVVVGGSQDTGVPRQDAPGSAAWTELATADGGDVAVNDFGVAGQSTVFWSTQNLGNFRRRVCTGVSTCGAATSIGLNVTAGGNPLGTSFVTPIELNSQDPTRLIIGGSNSVYESTDQGDNITELNSPGVGSNGMVYGHPNNADLIVVGQGSRVSVRTTAGGNVTATAADPPGGSVNDIAVDPTNASTMFVASGARVSRTTDSGATWTDITAGLAGMSGGSFQSILFVPNAQNDLLVVGTASGVFALAEPFCGCWFRLGTGIPNTFVWDLDYDVADDLLVAGSLGRSAWSLSGVGSLTAPANGTPIADLTASGGDVDAACIFLAPFSAVITDDCALDPNSVVVTASSLDGRATVGVPTVIVTTVSGTEIRVSGTVSVSDLTACPAKVRIGITAADACGLRASDTQDIEVSDHTPPTIAIAPSRRALWPPNHRFVPIHLTVDLADNCPGTTWALKSITSNEAENGLGDGDTAPDVTGAIFGTADADFQLRAERMGTGSGRIYTIVAEASDPCGNTSESTTQVTVPHDQSGTVHAVAGLTAAGNMIDPAATRVLLAIPSVRGVAEPSDEPDPFRAGATRAERMIALAFDASKIDLGWVELGNALGVVRPVSSIVTDTDHDGIRDLLLTFEAAPLRNLSERIGRTLGLHYVSGSGTPYLVPNILENISADGGEIALPDEPMDVQANVVPLLTRLSDIRPNPFRGSTTIAFDLAHTASVRVDIFAVNGRLIRSFALAQLQPGQHRVTWDSADREGRGLGSGVFLVRFTGDGVRQQRKLVLMN